MQVSDGRYFPATLPPARAGAEEALPTPHRPCAVRPRYGRLIRLWNRTELTVVLEAVHPHPSHPGRIRRLEWDAADRPGALRRRGRRHLARTRSVTVCRRRGGCPRRTARARDRPAPGRRGTRSGRRGHGMTRREGPSASRGSGLRGARLRAASPRLQRVLPATTSTSRSTAGATVPFGPNPAAHTRSRHRDRGD